MRQSDKKALVFLVVALAGVFAFVYMGMSYTEPPAQGTPASRDVEVSSYSIQQGQYSADVVGTAVNRTGRDLSYVSVSFNVLDQAGAVVGDAFTNMTNLRTGQSWHFEAGIIDPPTGSWTVRLEDVSWR